MIGFENVRLISLSVTLIDSLLARAPREQLLELLARSFHAAVQARNIAGYVLSRHEEEVFIAALLYNVGELAFWGCGGEQVEELAQLLTQPGIKADEAVQQVLGTSFRQLSLGLVRSWNLGELTSLAHSQAAGSDPAARAVALGVQISEAALGGWECERMTALTKAVADFTGVHENDALQQILASADETVRVAATFGQSSGQIDPEHRPRADSPAAGPAPGSLAAAGPAADAAVIAGPGVDGERQRRRQLDPGHPAAGPASRRWAGASDGGGAGRPAEPFQGSLCDRRGTADWLQGFVLPADQPEQPHVFSYALRHRQSLWMGVPASYNLADLVTQPLRQRLGSGMFFIAPLMAGTREIGVLYGDCRLSGRALKHEQFVAFQRFTQLTGRCLESLGKRPGG